MKPLLKACFAVNEGIVNNQGTKAKKARNDRPALGKERVNKMPLRADGA